jgi:UDP-glucose 4-epimerase
MNYNKKVLVTGGTGFIGSHTVIELVNSGYTPVIIDNFSNSNVAVLSGIKNIIGKDVIFYEGDCNDASVLSNIIDKEEISSIIHFAAYKAVGESVKLPLKYYYNNVGSLVNLLEVMKQKGLTNLVFSSSCTVYGQPDAIPVTEETTRKEAASPYGNTKSICEDILRDTFISGQNAKFLALRYFNPVGAHESAEIGELPNGVPSNLVPFITQTAAGVRESLTVFGNDYNTPDGTNIRDFIHVVDLAKAHVAALAKIEKTTQNFYDVFNIGTGSGNSVLEIIQTFEKVNNLKLNYKMGPRRDGDVEKIYGDVQKAAKELNWKVEKTLEDSLSDAWRWEKKIRNIN